MGLSLYSTDKDQVSVPLTKTKLRRAAVRCKLVLAPVPSAPIYKFPNKLIDETCFPTFGAKRRGLAAALNNCLYINKDGCTVMRATFLLKYLAVAVDFRK